MRELALVREAGARRDLRQGEVRIFSQELLRPFHAAGDGVPVRRQAGRDLELPREVGPRRVGSGARSGRWPGTRRRAGRPRRRRSARHPPPPLRPGGAEALCRRAADRQPRRVEVERLSGARVTTPAHGSGPPPGRPIPVGRSPRPPRTGGSCASPGTGGAAAPRLFLGRRSVPHRIRSCLTKCGGKDIQSPCCIDSPRIVVDSRWRSFQSFWSRSPRLRRWRSRALRIHPGSRASTTMQTLTMWWFSSPPALPWSRCFSSSIFASSYPLPGIPRRQSKMPSRVSSVHRSSPAPLPLPESFR